MVAGTEEISEVSVEFRSPEMLRTDRTGIVSDLETVGIYPASEASRRNHHITGMQITQNNAVTVQGVDGFR